VPEVTATVATAAVATKVTPTVASSMTTVASSVTTATTVASSVTTVPSRLGRHVGCGHHQTSSSDSREAINSGQGPKGQ
jgi:hypothetical protein